MRENEQAVPPEEADTGATSDNAEEHVSKFDEYLSTFVNIMIILVALATGYISYQMFNADYYEPALNGVIADLQRGQAEINAEGRARQNYNIFTYYTIYDTVARSYQSLDPEHGDDLPVTSIFLREVDTLADSVRFFFPGRYITADGDYNKERNVQELMAETAEKTDLNPDPYYAEFDELTEDNKGYLQVLLFFGLALAFYAFEEVLFWKRRSIRLFLTGVGTVVLIVGIVLLVTI